MMKRCIKQLLAVLVSIFLVECFSTSVYAENKDALIHEAVRMINLGEGWEALKILHEADNPELAIAVQRLENKQWKKILQKVYTTDGNVLSMTAYVYDEKGRCFESRGLSENGDINMIQITEYGEDGFPSAYCLYDSDGKLTSRSDLTCDEMGNIVRSEGGTNCEYVPNDYGDSSCIVRYGEDGVELSRTYYTFDVFGLYTGMTNVIDGKTRDVRMSVNMTLMQMEQCSMLPFTMQIQIQ